MKLFFRSICTITLILISVCISFLANAASLDTGEAAHLIFMREEEKLARDVYLTLAELYPGMPIFSNIANGSEQVHTDTMKAKLDQFGIADPNPDTNNLPDSLGIFTGADYGWYFTEKYGILTAWGEKSELNALYVGAYIEELDMLDIIECPKVIVETDNGIGEGECGLAYTDELALLNSLDSLVEGSKNHFRSYVEQIELIIGYGNYQAQVLTQEEVDLTLGD